MQISNVGSALTFAIDVVIQQRLTSVTFHMRELASIGLLVARTVEPFMARACVLDGEKNCLSFTCSGYCRSE